MTAPSAVATSHKRESDTMNPLDTTSPESERLISAAKQLTPDIMATQDEIERNHRLSPALIAAMPQA